jgi:PAS domain S-box-containing protein
MDNARAALALEAAHAGTWKWTIATGELEWDASLERVFGLEPGSFPGTFDAYIGLLHPDDREPTLQTVQQALADKVDHYVEHRILSSDGSVRWISGRGRVVLDGTGEPKGMVGIGEDITAQRLAEERLRFLAHAGDLLGSSLELGTTLQQLCDLAIEALADWCTVDLIDDDGVHLVAVAHRDTDRVAWARELRERFGVDMDSDVGLPSVLKTGIPYVLTSIDSSWLRQTLQQLPDISEDEVERFMSLELRSSMTVPLKSAKGEVLGAIGLVSAEGGRYYTDDDLTLALEIARRAATAVENAQLFSRTQHTSQTLQRSLMPPEIPALPFADVAVCFAPFGGQHDLIGGDFYDLLDIGDDTWCVILGDVAGKGVAAAALASATRWSFRSIVRRDADPARALRELNATLVTQDWEGRFVTAVVAVVRREPDGRLTIAFSVGGHPSPILRRADGDTRSLTLQGTLLGAFPDGTWQNSTVSLEPGDAFLLYSDGLTETAAPDGRLFGEEGVVAALASSECARSTTSADTLVKHLRSVATGFGRQRDDMAMLVLTCARENAPVLG